MKRIIAMLLAIVMLVGNVPLRAFAAVADLPVSEGSVDITDATVGPYTLSSLSVYLQGSYAPVSILSATQDGTTVDIVLAADTDPAAALQAGFVGSGQGQLQHSGNKCTLSNGKGTMNYSFAVRTGPQVVGQGTYTINFSIPMGEECQVTEPSGEGFTFTSGGAAYKDQPYTFGVTVNEGYDGSDMKISCQFGEEEISLISDGNGNYTIESVPGDITIVVEGVIAREKRNLTYDVVEGATVTGPQWVYEGDPCTFSVAVDGAYDAANMVVAVDGETVGTAAGEYKIDSVTADMQITVTGVVKKSGYTVTLTEGEHYTISGQATSYAGEPYTFFVTVDDAIYWASSIVVKVNGETVTLTDGSYTIESLNEDIVVTVENVVERTLYTVTKPEVAGVTVTGDDTVREGKPYTFSVAVDTVHYLATNMEVKVNGETVTLENGSYTVASAGEDIAITIEGVREKETYTVTKMVPEGMEDVVISGSDTVLETDSYSFTVSVPTLYDADAMVVTYWMGETTESMTAVNGNYTIPVVTGDVTVTVTGITKKDISIVEKPTGKKFTFAGDDFALQGSDYTFTVTPQLGYVAAVSVNGEEITGTNNQYTVKAEAETLTIAVTTQRIPLPDKLLTVTDNGDSYTAGTSNKITTTLTNSYYATITGIKVTGAVVNAAYEDGQTVCFMLDQDTPDTAKVDIEFLHTTSNKNVKLVQSKWSLDLVDGEGGLKAAVTARYSNSNRYDRTSEYTLIFFREIPSEEPPVRVMESDTAEVWKGWPLEIKLNTYFTDADTYYLVEGETKTQIEGSVYTYMSPIAGEQTLVFYAENEVGTSEAVTVTVSVKDLESGIYIAHATSNGSLDSVQFCNADGEVIEGIEVSYDQSARVITVVLPKDYEVSGTVKAKFMLTQNDGSYPFVSQSTETTGNRAYNSRFTEKSIQLTNGAANFVFYYYNTSTGANNNGGQTKFTIAIKMKNDPPELAEGVESATTATITAAQEYALDLSPIFTDIDNDTLTYQYKVGDGDWQDCDTAFTYSNVVAADYILTFRAFDTKDYSTEYYTVTLTVENVKDTYDMTVSVPAGLEPKFYVSTGYVDGVDQLGDVVETVVGETADGMTAYTLSYPQNAEMLSVRAEGWGGMAFACEQDGAVTLRQVKLLVVDFEKNPAESTNTVTYSENKAVAGAEGWLLVTGQEYSYKAEPKDTATCATVIQKEILEAGADVYSREMMLNVKNPMAITVPTGARAQLYKYNQYYSNTELDAKIVTANEDGTTTYQFVADTKANGANFIYRVSMEGKITKAGWLAWGQQNLTVTYSDSDVSPAYRLDDYTGTGAANSGVAEDSVLLNINSRNHLSLSVGQTKVLKAYRAWEIIPVSYNNYILPPDFTYTVLYGSDVVSLSEKVSASAVDGDWMTLTALKEGIAVIEVTYDAIQVTGGQYDGIYGASDPARTGLVVVQVGGSDDDSVNFGIDCFASIGKAGSNNVSYNPNNKKAWDAEFDTLYFTGSSGELKLSPSASSAIAEVAVSHDKGGSWTVLTGDNGTYTATIVSGNNILRVKTASGTAYQVVRGDRISVNLKEVDGKSDGDGIVEAGETVRVSLIGLHNPIPKMAGNYNPGYGGNSDGYGYQHLNYTANGEAVYGTGAQYNFITAANYVDVVMPEDGSSMTLSDGYIGLGVIGLTGFTDGGDSHRNIPDGGCITRGNQSTWHTRSILPKITIEAGGESAPNTAPIVRADAITEGSIYDDQKFAINPDTLFQDADDDTLSFTVSVNGAEAVEIGIDYKFVPEAAGTYTLTFTASDGEYTAEHTVTVTVMERPQEGGEDDQFDLEESEIAGYVTISFEDNGIRVEGEKGLKFPVPLGTIIEPTKVPYKEGENIAQVTKRLLDHLGMGMKYSGTLESGFYLGAITNFEVDGTPYASMAEFDAGVGSGWMITQNDVFINQGASEFKVKDSDILKWQYSCQLGADIGDDFYAAVNATIKLIDEIGEITLDSGNAIKAAREAYDKLTESEKQRVSNYQKLTDAEAKYAELTQAAADQAAAKAVEEKIAAIGTVTLESKSVIDAARAAYEELGDTQKELVGNYQILLDAEEKYAELVKTAADEAAAKTVADMIDAIGTVDLDSESKINAARQAYDALTDVQKTLVTNRNKLEAAEKKLNELKNEAAADTVEAMISAIGTVRLDSEDKIKAARAAYDALTDAQKKLVENITDLETAEETLELLKLAGTDITDIYKTTGDYLAGLPVPSVGTTNGEWRVIGLARAGRTVADGYYEAAVEYVKNNIDENGRLHPVKSTDNSRLIVALTAIGKDVTDVGGFNLLPGLDEMEYIGKQGINGTIWALIAFDTHEYEIPSGDVSRKALLDEILSKQLSDGGWALSGSTSDPDMTGMALQALAPYYKTNSAVKKAVDEALTWLGGVQNNDGTFTGSEGITAESLAQVITGLTALGINPETDSRFVKNGVSAVDALSMFYVEGGGFKHDLNSDRNIMATEQGYYALAAYSRLLQGKTALYDMSDVNIHTAAKDQEAADAVEALITAIGTVTEDSGEKIKAAREAYDALTKEQQNLVANYERLTAAEAAYAEIVKTAEDEAAAKAVEEQIGAIGTVTLDSKRKIEAARDAYDDLSDVQKALVKNYKTLTDAEAKYAELVKEAEDKAAANAVEKLIDEIGTVTKNSGSKIKAAREAYDKLTPAQKKLVKNYSVLEAAEKKFEEEADKITVRFTLLGDSNHGDKGSAHTYAGGGLATWIPSKAVTVRKPATVWDVFKAAVHYSYTNSGNYISSVNGLAEFSNGPYSGWMYTLNGDYPNLGVEEQSVADGDVIVFHYTDDYRLEKSGMGITETTVQDVIRLIKEIGTVTLDKETAIQKAREAYEKLSAAEKAQVHNYDDLTAAEAKLSQLQIQDAINTINEIGTVTLNSGSKIDTAWNTYNALTPEQKAKVTNLSKLVQAQNTYDALRAEETESLIDLIDDEVTLESEKAILTARKSYNALSDAQKKLVDARKLEKLKAAELALAELKATDTDKQKAQKVVDLIEKLGEITLGSEEDIQEARKAYDKLTDLQKALVTNYDVLEAAEEKLEELKYQQIIKDIYISTGDYMEKLGTPGVGTIGGEWMVIGLARSGRTVPGAEDYYEAVVQFVRENIDEQERLHSAKSTENARIILALTALGKDVTNVDGHNLLLGLNDLTYLQKQGINGPIWALIALDSGNYPVPEGNVTRTVLIETILNAQLADGGWALSGNTADADMTGMALQALAPYYRENEKVTAAVDNALATVSLMQYGNGGFSGIDGESSESITQILVALTALGIDPAKDARFVKNGESVLDALITYYVEGGGFRHTMDGELNGMATEQCYYALTAYFRMLERKTSLYDMTDVMDLGGDPLAESVYETAAAVPAETVTEEGENAVIIWIGVAALSTAAIVVILLNRKKFFGKFL